MRTLGTCKKINKGAWNKPWLLVKIDNFKSSQKAAKEGFFFRPLSCAKKKAQPCMRFFFRA